ncbi:LacI family transcriptional regulator [Rhodococcus sp. WMMA185]|uniref:LacI family DNA-binding transcriptional regulator n=1 Tax=Rhodococcus sp. WMMA185 TaxID=679318 RepID=UPI000878A5DE|nr:LacI family DNA-binding transcriptional regulator [Rhodococcus sp. WMMA185]AOW92557.1 LacI family transcriptional regulator [Rhodococcus sp. WMMA185]
MVAEAAGVSTATVSRVMSGNPAVSPELAARVHAAAEEMAYRPSGAARGLALGSLRNVGVIVPDLANAYFLEVVKQMHHGGRADGYRMLVADYSAAADDEYATAVDLLGQVDGLILLSSRIPVSGLKDLAAQSTPVVLVNRVELGVDLPMVAVDNFTAMMELCGHLAELGHRRVVYIAGSDLSWQNRERWRAVEMARVLGIEAFKVDSDGSIEGGFSVTESALGHEPTALICFNDLTAVGVISKLRELGVRVPEDISVTGFDDVELAGHIAPRLTTVLSPKIQLGDQAWRLLQEALRSEPGTLVPLLPAKVVIRDSTGTVRD